MKGQQGEHRDWVVVSLWIGHKQEADDMLDVLVIGGLLTWLFAAGSGTSQSFKDRFRGKVETFKRCASQANEKARLAKQTGNLSAKTRYRKEAASLAHTAVIELSSVYEGLKEEIDRLQREINNASGSRKRELIAKIKPLRSSMGKLKSQVAHAKQFRNAMNRRCSNGGHKRGGKRGNGGGPKRRAA